MKFIKYTVWLLLALYSAAFIKTLPVYSQSSEQAGEPVRKVSAAKSAPSAALPGSALSGRSAESADTDTWNIFHRLGFAAAIVILQIILIRFTWFLFSILRRKIKEHGGNYFKPLKIKTFRILSTSQIIDIIFFCVKILKYIVTIFLLYITLPIVLHLFPLTRDLASTLFDYILDPLKSIGIAVVTYIPNLFTIAIIIFITRYVMRSLKFFATQIARQKVVIPGFYSDWAHPTFNILRVFLYAFTVALIYPYLPLSDSNIFKGVSVFVGVIISLGSSSAIGNLVAGIVITYMRPFKIGDRIKINDITGFVVEKSPIVIRLRTDKNEYVTFPNMMVLNSNIFNYQTSSEEEEGLIINTEITMGYAIPWPLVHKILINAAAKTKYVEAEPKPFVLQTALDDFYGHYQINAYVKEVSKIPAIYSQLYENIQEGFKAEGIDMTAPSYYDIKYTQKTPKPVEPLKEQNKPAKRENKIK